MQFGSGVFDKKSFLESDFETKVSSYHNKHPTQFGLPQWRVSEWKGTLYPKGLPVQEYLSHYAQIFQSVEVSSTFYAPVNDETIIRWREQVGKHFQFIPKWPKRLTHQQLLSSDTAEVKNFIRQMMFFEDKLGPTLLQLPPHFSYDYKRELFHFLENIPNDFPLAVELRHSSWFWPARGMLQERFFDYLCHKKISTVITDTPARRDLFHLNSTGPRLVIRYLSDGDPENDRIRLDWWRLHLLDLEQQTQVHFILHKTDNENVVELIDLIAPVLAEKRKQFLDETQQGELVF